MSAANDRSVTISVRALNIVAEIAEVQGHEIRINIDGGKQRWAVVTEAGNEVAIQALFDSQGNAVEAAQALEALIRAQGGPHLVHSSPERPQ